MEETNITLFPPSGAGTANMEDPRGRVLQQLIPGIEYPKVREYRFEKEYVAFVTRTGDAIVSNLPYIIKTVQVQPDGHEA